ncbi:MAG: glycogen/starch synthase [Bacteroidetes bacterium]|nr:glycogen/starch synthase [Bacteroidota bacterium]
MEKKRVLFVSQEISPFLTKSNIANTSLRIAQSTQEEGKEIRVFTPRYGSINERRHQLHEVIRLSGLNISIDDQDHPLIIKVASVAAAKMQVYFIDNDDFFRRKDSLSNEDGVSFKDNDERSIFFVRGVLETLKKLGWQPDVIHCHGWFTGIMALYIKHFYKKDPHFKETKIVYHLYNDSFTDMLDLRLPQKLAFDGFPKSVTDAIKKPDFETFTQLILNHCDGATLAEPLNNPKLKKIYSELNIPKLEYIEEADQSKAFSAFFNGIIDDTLVVK